MMLRHVSSRWLSLKKVLIRILDQWKNLQKYFLEDLPKEKTFGSKIRDTERYIDIVRALKAEKTRLYTAFAIYVSEIMEGFLLRFQSKAPMVHLMYEGIGRLLYDIMSNFIKSKTLMENESVDRKEACVLGLIDVKNPQIQKKLDNINPGTQAKHIIANMEVKNNSLVHYQSRVQAMSRGNCRLSAESLTT